MRLEPSIRQTALLDLQQAGDDLWPASPRAAARWSEDGDAAVQTLGAWPDLGRPFRLRQGLMPGLRVWRIARSSHLLFYRVGEETQTLEGWRVRHGARDLPRRLSES